MKHWIAFCGLLTSHLPPYTQLSKFFSLLFDVDNEEVPLQMEIIDLQKIWCPDFLLADSLLSIRTTVIPPMLSPMFSKY